MMRFEALIELKSNLSIRSFRAQISQFELFEHPSVPCPGRESRNPAAMRGSASARAGARVPLVTACVEAVS